MPDLSEYAAWYYLLYLLPGGTALVLLLLSALGGMRHGTGHHATGHHVTGHHAAGQPPAIKHTTLRQGTGPAYRAPFLTAFFGLERVPVTLVWGSALLGWGIFGFWGTQLWQSFLHFPAAFVLPALATALAGALVTEKVTVEAVSRFLPGDETFAVSAVDLCGLTGEVVFPVDTGRGRVHVYDVHGTLHEMSARTAAGQGTVARGQSVLVVDYDAGQDQLIVEG